ncbi:uncharacterized protein LOC125757253 [Rhipicephalus sanguineus]|uniref:uncharacterized protein LOC125757253 n=1 Tax=Rhipicephalus sanguineus TaxID=34632 RepID=UPI0020C592A7|nr:uncharacterized protein LOC125757253 [Rhipicephalus sanguineus]
MNRVAANAASLIMDVDNNDAEHYNSVVAKFVGGKRINYSMKGSYKTRCLAASLSVNCKGTYHEKIARRISGGKLGKCTASFVKASVARRKSKQKLPKKAPSTTPRSQRRVKEHHPGADVDYGLPDMEPGALATASENFVKSLSLSVTSIEDLQRATSKQSGSSLWKHERRKRLTASVFGAICKMKPTTGCGRTVGDILYKEISSEAIRYGRDHECVALRQLEKECNVVVKQCGLFVDQENPFLGASPDGLIGEDVLVEVKCPYSARDLTPLEGVRAKKITYCTENEDGKLKLKSNSNYWSQVQGQMNISRRQKCLFVVWTKNGISIEAISRDEVFWKNEMFPRLKTFYMHCMLPELVDPRRSRGLPIREPDHITEAQKNRLLKQALKKTSRNGDCQ